MKRFTSLTTVLLFGALTAGTLQAQPDVVQPADIHEVDATVLATFELANGNEVHFYGVPKDGELMMGEVSDAGFEQFVIDPAASPAEVFATLAPADLAVPRMIAESDELGLLAGRQKVEILPDVIQADAFGDLSTRPQTRAGSGSCQTGNPGANYFNTHHCGTLGGPGYGSSEGHCYAGSYNSIQKTSNSKRRTTYTRIASCGGGMNHFRHFYKKTSGYYTQVNVYLDPQKVVSWWSSTTGIKRYRRVRFEESQSAGWVRGWIKYLSEVAGGW